MTPHFGRRCLAAAGGLTLAAIYGLAVGRLDRLPRPSIVDEMQVALPRFVQVLAGAGDRFLAANIATFRALVASTERMQEGNFRVQGILQADAAWLNPGHEDNYYVAAAILPWNGEFEAGQDVLRKASRARPFDWQPAFYYAFDIYHFERDPLRAAKVLRAAAPRARSENDRYALETVASYWLERGHEPRAAVRAIEAMADGARSGRFRAYLQLRANRLRGLILLQEAAQQYQLRTGRPIHRLEDLVTAGLIAELPADPFGFGYTIGPDGVPLLNNAPKRTKR